MMTPDEHCPSRPDSGLEGASFLWYTEADFYSLFFMFLDIKLGLLWAFAVALLFEKVITPEWLVAGVVFALIPDIDFWLEYIKRGTVGGTVIDLHRTLLHAPITYIPVALFVGTYAGPAWMMLFILGVFGHFLHDSMGMSHGIRWFWPFTDRWYKFFSAKDGEIHYDFDHFLVSWSDEEMRALMKQRGNDHWIEEDLGYMRRHWKGIIGKLIITLIAVALLIIVLPL